MATRFHRVQRLAKGPVGSQHREIRLHEFRGGLFREFLVDASFQLFHLFRGFVLCRSTAKYLAQDRAVSYQGAEDQNIERRQFRRLNGYRKIDVGKVFREGPFPENSPGPTDFATPSSPRRSMRP